MKSLLWTVTTAAAAGLLYWQCRFGGSNNDSTSTAPATLVSSEELARQLLERVKDEIYLDAGRLEFVIDACRTLADLALGRLANANGRSRLLLGCKGVGKSRLLQALREAAVALLKDVVVVHIDYNDGTSPLLFDYIALQLGLRREWEDINTKMEKFPLVDRHHTFDELLGEKNKRLFLVVDEAQNIYRASCTNGKEIVQELSYIANTTSGNFFCIISGSNSHLRLLLYNKLPENLKSKYPNFDHIDMNDSKFCPYSIYPLHTPEDLLEFTERHRSPLA